MVIWCYRTMKWLTQNAYGIKIPSKKMCIDCAEQTGRKCRAILHRWEKTVESENVDFLLLFANILAINGWRSRRIACWYFWLDASRHHHHIPLRSKQDRTVDALVRQPASTGWVVWWAWATLHSFCVVKTQFFCWKDTTANGFGRRSATANGSDA